MSQRPSAWCESWLHPRASSPDQQSYQPQSLREGVRPHGLRATTIPKTAQNPSEFHSLKYYRGQVNGPDWCSMIFTMKNYIQGLFLGWMMHRCSQVSTMHANKTCNTSRAHLRRNAWASHFELLHFHTFLRELAWNVLPADPDQTWPPYHIAMDLAEYD